MYAIIEDSGTQIRVAPGDVVEIDLRDSGAKDKIKFDRVLLVSGGDDAPPTIGTPYVAGASVTADVVDEIRADKVDVIKYKRRKGYQLKRGHRQRYLRVKINEIKAPGSGRKKPAQKED
ncbi:MAG: 50S ribosomal protein L21 [Planctomycetota bacterium]|jgi:large subunit ribosomal protein L21